MKKALVLLIAVFCEMYSWSQDVPKVEIPVGFSLVNFHPELSLASFNYYGGGGQVDFNFGRIFGVKADLMGYTQGSGLKNQLNQLGLGGPLKGNLFTYMFGPQIKKHSGILQPFAEAMFGGAHSNMSGTILADEGRLPHGTGFAMALGGGIDLRVTDRLALRPVEVDYLLTRFSANVPNYTASQNNFRYVAGLSFLFGRAR